MVEADTPQTQAPPTVPAWRWLVFLVGSACLVIMIFSSALKGWSRAELILWLVPGGLSVLGCVAYFVGRYTFWAKYPRQELRFAFTPIVLSAVIFVGLLLALTIVAILDHYVL